MSLCSKVLKVVVNPACHRRWPWCAATDVIAGFGPLILHGLSVWQSGRAACPSCPSLSCPQVVCGALHCAPADAGTGAGFGTFLPFGFFCFAVGDFTGFWYRGRLTVRDPAFVAAAAGAEQRIDIGVGAAGACGGLPLGPRRPSALRDGHAGHP